jgi:16S rRNA (uracil1498-N3)-methyltransferase
MINWSCRALELAAEMTERFYLPANLNCRELQLEGAEAHHLIHVLRAKTGQDIIVFDGAGQAADATVVEIARSSARLRILSVRTESDNAHISVTLATAVPKGDRFRWLIEKATELGVERVIPLMTERSVVDPRQTKLDKLKQTVVAACKQCGRNRLMQIENVMSWNSFVSSRVLEQKLLVAHPVGNQPAPQKFNEIAVANQEIVIVVGPEGGFTENEIQTLIQHGAQLVDLGPRILRIETAAISLIAWLNYCVHSSGC